jgi:hypothetical protein
MKCTKENRIALIQCLKGEKMMGSTTEIVLHLDEIGKFFSIPDPDPLAGNQVYEPGIDSVYDQARASRVKNDLNLILYLPPNQVSKTNEKDLKTGIVDFSDFQIYKLQNSLAMQKRQGRRTLYYGLTILIICLLLSGLGFYLTSIASTPLLYAIGGFMFNGFMIIGWVSLWTPTSMLVFERWPDIISKKTYERIKEMTIEIRPEPA